MKKPNQNVRDDLEMLGIRHWQVAQALGISEATFSRWMRTQLSPAKETRVYLAINRIKDERPIYRGVNAE